MASRNGIGWDHPASCPSRRQRKRQLSQVEHDSRNDDDLHIKRQKFMDQCDYGTESAHPPRRKGRSLSQVCPPSPKLSGHSSRLPERFMDSRRKSPLSHCGKKRPRESGRHKRYHDNIDGSVGNAIGPNSCKRRKLSNERISMPSSSQASRRRLSPEFQFPKKSPSRGTHQTPYKRVKKEWDSSWEKGMVAFSPGDILSAAELPRDDLIEKLSNSVKAFQYTLQKQKLLIRTEIMEALIEILYKVADPSPHSSEPQRNVCLQILGEAQSDRCAMFKMRLQQHIINELCFEQSKHQKKKEKTAAACEQQLHTLCKLFDDMLHVFPTNSKSWIPFEDLQYAVEKLPVSSSRASLHAEVEALSLHLDKVREEHSKASVHNGEEEFWNNFEFRDIDIIPLWNEVCVPQTPLLRKNKITGSYTDWFHYFDIHFRLLREDFVAPLRRGICEYLHGMQGRQLSDISVYKKVVLKEPILKSPHGACYKIELSDLSKKIDWEHSKRLLHGSLLCLTPEEDNFKESCYFATVIYRDPKAIAEGELIIMFKREEQMLLLSCKDVKFTMVESCAYFEASQHILHSIQTAEPSTMPFTQYLIKGDPSHVNQPQYLASTSKPYNLTTLLTEEEKERIMGAQDDLTADLPDGEIIDDLKSKEAILESECFQTSDITDISSWPTCDQTGLDASQMKGIQMALTKEIAIIQGPPGTGKTYIGLKIVEALLNNRKLCGPYNSPILVMCYTNHALDQFLEGIVKSPLYSKEHPPRLVRIGGRSQSKELADFNLVEVRKKVFLPIAVRLEKKNAEEAVKNFRLFRIQRFLSLSNGNLTFSQKELAKYNVISPDHDSQLQNQAQIPQELNCVMEMWLGLDSSNPKLNERIDVVLSDFESKACKEVPQQTKIFHAGKECPSLLLKDSKQECEINDSDLEVEGDATAEQSKRILDDEHPDDVFRRNLTSYVQHCHGEYENRCILFDVERARKVISYGFSLKPMTEEESRKVGNICSLSFDNRWRLYQLWHTKCVSLLAEECEENLLEYNRLCSKQAKIRSTADCFALETADIIGMTTTGAAKYQHVLRQIKPRIVIVEEAAEVLESHIVSVLNAGTQHLILIGDHKQLRPKPNEYDLEVKYNLSISLFERLILNKLPHVTLKCQHRMRPEIAELVKPHIYKDLSNHSSVEKYPENIRGVSTALFFISHTVEEESGDNLCSHSNIHEAKYLVSLCRYLLQQEYSPKQITILVTYTGQMRTMRKLMKEEFYGVRVSTVDNFQGEENDIILLSLVRSNKEGRIGFLEKANRVCVAFSRARHGFFCIGNFSILRKKSCLWENIVMDMEKKKRLGDGLLLHCSNHPEISFVAETSEDFTTKSPKGGCQQYCNVRLKCGHQCGQKCHYTNMKHNMYECKKQCDKLCSEGHPCSKRCCDPCGKCRTKVIKTFPGCEHKQAMFCHQDPSEVNCYNPCKITCPKGHLCPFPCYKPCQPCEYKISHTFPSCQHQQWIKCHEDPASIKCKAKCSHECEKGHPCRKRCYEECGECTELVPKVVDDCNHEVKLKCHIDPKHSECTMPCKKNLPCNHKCLLKCGEDCSKGLCKELVSAKLPGCKHEVEVPCHSLLDLSRVTCPKLCESTLPCKHQCDQKCGDPCQTSCQVMVNKEWPCGHQLNRPCYQTAAPETYPCQEKCSRKLVCGHQCSKKCNQTCDKKCRYLCSQKLLCGHKCMGRCFQCTDDNMHKPCSLKIQFKRFCGHSFRTTCSGLMDEHSGPRDLMISCSHKDQKVDCSTTQLFHSCNEKCHWNCQHFSCSKICTEMCDRPKCDKTCLKLLKCGHLCYGLCGEPCLSVCPQCQLKVFNAKLQSAEGFEKESRYYELPCKHIFPVQYLDDYVKQLTDPKSHILVCPIQCPVNECSQPLSCSYRYGNAAKQSFSYIQDVNAVISKSDTRNSRPLLENRLDFTFDFSPGRKLTMILNDSVGKYLVFVLIEVVRMSKILNSLSSTSSDCANHVEKLQSLLNKLTSNSCVQLSSQIIDSIKEEHVSLVLHLSLLIVKSEATIADSDLEVMPSPNSCIIASESNESSLILSPVNDSLSDSDDSDLIALRRPSINDSDRILDSFSVHSMSPKLISNSPCDQENMDVISENEFPPSPNKDGLFSPVVMSAMPASTILSDANTTILAAEEYLKTPQLHNLQTTQTHCKLLQQFIPKDLLDIDRILQEMDWFYPAFHKGQWWRCPKSKEYLCLPIINSDDDNEVKCIKCEDTFDVTQLCPPEKTASLPGNSSNQGESQQPVHLDTAKASRNHINRDGRRQLYHQQPNKVQLQDNQQNHHSTKEWKKEVQRKLGHPTRGGAMHQQEREYQGGQDEPVDHHKQRHKNLHQHGYPTRGGAMHQQELEYQSGQDEPLYHHKQRHQSRYQHGHQNERQPVFPHGLNERQEEPLHRRQHIGRYRGQGRHKHDLHQRIAQHEVRDFMPQRGGRREPSRRGHQRGRAHPTQPLQNSHTRVEQVLHNEGAHINLGHKEFHRYHLSDNPQPERRLQQPQNRLSVFDRLGN